MAEESTIKPLRVVTVDDSPLIAARIGDLLAEIPGIELKGKAGTIAEALSLIETELPDVVLLDIHLASDKPKTGIDLLHIASRIYPDVKVIMLTNLTDHSYRLMCESSGAYMFLDKSNDFEKIPQILIEIRGQGEVMHFQDN
jgi:DNA-binding NarL/FixJ family response regulator